ncbi:MAG: lipoprotein [Paracoccaceae bacterium]
MRIGIIALVALAMLTGCNRNKPKLTECVDGRPVVERTLDVAPPNC